MAKSFALKIDPSYHPWGMDIDLAECHQHPEYISQGRCSFAWGRLANPPQVLRSWHRFGAQNQYFGTFTTLQIFLFLGGAFASGSDMTKAMVVIKMSQGMSQ